MSMTIQTSSRVACFAVQTVDAARPVRRHDAEATAERADSGPSHGQVRHALADALSNAPAGLTETGGASAADDGAAVGDGRTDKKALREFEHALFDALRPARGEDGAPGRQGHGFAWGRTSLGDIAERLQALAQQFAASGPTEDAAPAAEAAATPPDGAEAASMTQVRASTPSTQSAGEATPAPPSRLLSAFQSLLDRVGGEGSASTDARGSLATLLTRMAQALQPAAEGAAPAAGALLDTTA
jgi:hypothetical protein